MATQPVICQKWEESEKGWGTRPDGYSLHLTETDRAAFVQAYWDSMPDEAPSEYERPSGSPYECLVDAETFAAIAASVHGIRKSGHWPDGGVDGWLSKYEQQQAP
jgi:hypothetical protein